MLNVVEMFFLIRILFINYYSPVMHKATSLQCSYCSRKDMMFVLLFCTLLLFCISPSLCVVDK